MAKFPGFIGPSYTSRSSIAESERTMNFYTEIIESGAGRNQLALYPTPGLKVFATLSEKPVRALANINGKCFAVGGTKLSELFADKSVSEIGAVGASDEPATICGNGTQVYVADPNGGFTYTLGGSIKNVGPTGVVMGAYVDGYFIALLRDSNKFQISALLDGNTWDAADVFKVSLFPDDVRTIIADHRELWLLGRTKSVVYYNSGDPDNPFQPIQGSVIEQGDEARWAPARLDNSLFWLGGDERGQGMVWRAQGYTPARVSNHAVEHAIQGYSRRDDAIGYTYQDEGHAFYVLQFPTAGATWVYDAATASWHERGYWDQTHAVYKPHRSRCHCAVFGKHLVGDTESGKVYEMSLDLLDDDGTAIRRLRRAPHLTSEKVRLRHRSFELDCEMGLGLEGSGQGSDPQIMMRWSNDGGKTWSNEHWVSAGKIGEYKKRAIWRRLGQARDRVYETVFSEPTPLRIMDAYIDVGA